MANESGVMRTMSAISAGTTGSETAAVVSASLEGLVSAVDELKRSMGLGEQVDFAAVEEFVRRLQMENEEFRQYAEEAILSAQRLRDERDELQSRLDQAALESTLGAALAETQKLKDVADEFEKDLYEKKLVEAEARAAEAEALKERIAELEEENAGLTQTLNEFRATTQQLQKLQSHEVRRLQAVEAGGLTPATGISGSKTPTRMGPSEPRLVESVLPQLNGGGGGVAGLASSGSSPATSPSGDTTAPASKPGRSPGASPRVGGKLGAAAAAATPVQPSAQATEALRIADQLEEVVGGGDSGLLSEAVVALRELSRRDMALQQAQQENTRLKTEVDELNDTMFSKTFKPPSAWAEREIKYKSDKRHWEEQQKEAAARLAALAAQLEAYRGYSKANELEERIQELEARLLQSEREKDSVRAQLHELQLSLRTEGEFGNAGKRLSPYKGPLGAAAAEGHEVQQMVDHLEHGGIGIESPETGGAVGAAAASRLHGIQAKLAAAASENLHLRRQLIEQQVVAVPPSLRAELGQTAAGAALVAAAADLEARLARAEAASQALRQQVHGGDPQRRQGEGEGVSATAPAGAAAEVADKMESQAQKLEEQAQQAGAAGEQEEAARLRQQAAQLQRLGQRLRATEEERAALAAQLAELAPVRLQIAAAMGEDAGEGGQPAAAAAEEVAVPTALQAELGGATAPAAAVAAKAAELERRLGESERQTVELQQQTQQAVALSQQAQRAQQAQREVAARLAPAQDGTAGVGEEKEEVEQLRAELAAVQRQKEAAQQRLWQLTDRAEQLQRAEAERRRLAAQLKQAQVVTQGGGDGEETAAEGAEFAELAQLHAELATAQQHSSELRSQLQALQAPSSVAAPVSLALHLADGSGDEGADVSSNSAHQRLAAAEAEAARLRQQLADLQPIRLQLALADGSSGGVGGGDATPPRARTTMGSSVSVSPAPVLLPGASTGAATAAAAASPGDYLLTTEPSDISLGSLLQYGDQTSSLSMERAEVDAAWQEHQKASDVPSLLRAKVELETRCQMLEAQMAKMQGELAVVDETNAVMEDHLDTVLKTGDVSALDALRDKLASGRQSLSKRMFKRQQGKPSPSKDTLKNTVHEMQGALASSEEERNALKRQLAKLSKKYQQVTQQQAHTAGIVAGAAAMQARAGSDTADSEVDEARVAEAALAAIGRDEDSELELLKMREENQMLMEHVVMVKVRQAEMEGEYLEAKRQLLRTREKNVQLVRKLAALREAAEKGEPLPLTPRGGGNSGSGGGGDTAAAAAAAGAGRAPAGSSGQGSGGKSAEQPMRKGLLRIPGL